MIDRLPKPLTRRLVAGVDAILWGEWDPIGINSHPEARDEYSSYAAKAADLALAGANSALQDYLQQIEFGWMGLAPSQRAMDSIDRVAARLIESAAPYRDAIES
ncbi:MAG: hypothetical protein IPJ41_15955 [Phycisphaerales bacterium]|nr:hypothetical protein [Phycisphaerales bacterium]